MAGFRMPEQENRTLERLADAFVESSNRSRRVIIIMILASIILGMALWNSMSDSWIKSRIKQAYIALEHRAWVIKNFPKQIGDTLWLHKIPLQQEKRWILNIDSLDNKIEEWQLADTTALVFMLDTTLKWRGPCDTISVDGRYVVSDSLPKLEEIWQALYLCDYRNLKEKADVDKYLDKLETLRTERVTVVPISAFGLVLDVNDLAFLGGLTFLVLLMWLRLSIARELANLRIVLEVTGEMGNPTHKYWYLYLAMRQVMTVPRLPTEVRRGIAVRLWRIVPRVLFFTPFLVQSGIMWYDRISIVRGRIVNPVRSAFNFWAGWLLLAFIFILTLWSLIFAVRADQEWDRAADQLGFPKLRRWRDIHLKVPVLLARVMRK